ncbi:DNA polymerase III subunit gamma/tau [Faecalibacterium sp. An122]|uniref:DNA polymerase III subunit gamma/tau n=1 Tax=Faecalibacterium sp. An122 TaxID=1965551 RepID=UPI000B395FF0|nr:DNA polymerase III subunit gamma/tau [Faecalibacterium sp. An122]OUQ33540.1 hypothetical protein B5E67_14650 [Faecalibacterium sp. An122]
MYRALYRKWRPQRFEDVVGQRAIVAALKNQVASGRVGHAYLFTGVRGTGKTTCAKIFAKAVNCLNPQGGDPCCQCAVCRGIDGGSILDVVEMDAASNNGVDDIRDLRDETAYTPSSCTYKVYIIDEVHMLSTAAFNALLKTLEEPPAHVIFILATTEIQKVPATIRSRCQRYDFTRISPEDIAGRVAQVAAAEQLSLTDKAAALIARLADGALRDALSILDTCAGVTADIDENVVRRMAGVTDRSYLFRISQAVSARDAAGALAELAALRQQSVDVKRLTEELIAHYRSLMLAALPGGQELLSGVSPDEEALYLEQGPALGRREAVRAIRALGVALEHMARGSDQRIELELALFSLTEPAQTQQAAAVPAAAAAQPARQAVPAAAQPVRQETTVRPFASAPVSPAPAAPATAPAAQSAQDLPPWEEPAAPATAPAAQSAQDLPPWEEPAAPAAPAVQSTQDLPPWEEPAAPATAPAAQSAQDLPPWEEPAAPAAPAAQSAQDLPPWEEEAPPEEPAPPAPWPETPPEEPAAQPVYAADPQLDKPRRAAADGVNPYPQWAEVVNRIQQTDPMLYGYLKKSKAYFDGVRVLIDGGKTFRDFIRVNKGSQRLIKKLIAEVSGIAVPIGPYEPEKTAARQKTTAEDSLHKLEALGLEVTIEDNARKRRS